MRLLANTNFNFIRWRWHALVLSIVVIALGVSTIARRGGLSWGVDFTGGTSILLQFQQPTSEDTVRDALSAVVNEPHVQQIGPRGQNQIMVRLPVREGETQGAALEANAKRVQDALGAVPAIGAFNIEHSRFVGPVIGQDLRRRGIFAMLASLVGIMAYIAFRFRLSFGAGAIVASVHDILVTLSILAIAQYEITLNVVAAILALTGYGVNDQIVVFDRVREKLRVMRREPMSEVINRAVNETLPRTVITAGVTFLAVFALYLFGGEVLEGFAFAMLVGIVTSTYSTIYIASAVAVLLSPRRESVTAAGAAAKGSKAGKTAARRT